MTATFSCLLKGESRSIQTSSIHKRLLLWLVEGHIKISLDEGSIEAQVIYPVGSFGARVINHFLRTGNVVAIMQINTHDNNEVLRGRVGVIEAVKLRVLVPRERWR